LPTGTPSPRCCARRSLPPRRRGWRGRPPPFPRSVPRCTGTRRRRGRSSCARTPAWIRCAAPGGARCLGTSRSGSVRPVDRGRCHPRHLRPPGRSPSSNRFLRERVASPAAARRPSRVLGGWVFSALSSPGSSLSAVSRSGRARSPSRLISPFSRSGCSCGPPGLFPRGAAAVSGFLLAASGTAAGGSALFLCLRKFPFLEGVVGPPSDLLLPRTVAAAALFSCGAALLSAAASLLGWRTARYGRK